MLAPHQNLVSSTFEMGIYLGWQDTLLKSHVSQSLLWVGVVLSLSSSQWARSECKLDGARPNP